jgi:hypothetical protein
MNLGSVLTVFSLLIAFASFAYNSTQRIVFYKFRRCRVWLVALIGLILVNYLLMFDWAYANNIYISCLYRDNRYPTPDQWAYVITIGCVLWVIYHVIFNKSLPLSKAENILDYYEELIYRDLPLLVRYIRDYHLTDIHKTIEKLNSFKSLEVDDFLSDIREDTHANCKATWGGLLLDRIIFNPAFISQCVEYHYEEFYLTIIRKINNSQLYGFEKAVERFYDKLIETKDAFITEALTGTINFNEDSKFHGVAYRIHEYKFSQLTFSDLNFIENSKLCRVFGEAGLQDADNNSLYTLTPSEWLDRTYFRAPARLCLSFYDIYIRQYIYERLKKTTEIQCQPYFEYFHLNCNAAIVNCSCLKGTYAERLYLDTRETIYNLIKIQVTYQCKFLIQPLLHEISNLFSLLDLNTERKIELAKWIIENVVEIANIAENSISMQIVSWWSCMTGKPGNSSVFKQALSSVDTACYAQYPEYETIINQINLPTKSNR